MKKWIAAVVVVVIVIAAAVWYKAGSASAVVESPETTAPPAPTATPEPTPAAAETTSDTGEKYEVSPGVYNDGTTRELTSEEVANMTAEEQRQYIQDTMRDTGAVGSLDELDGVTAEEAEKFMDETWNVDNPYIKDIIDSGVLNN